jgi:hypothetical protein
MPMFSGQPAMITQRVPGFKMDNLNFPLQSMVPHPWRQASSCHKK